MKLHAGIFPPPEALEPTLAAVRAALPVSRAPARPVGRGADRWTVRSAVTTGAMPEDERFVTVARFGNVTPADSSRLARGLGAAAAEWLAPIVHVAGVTLEPTHGGVVVMAQLQGDVDGLRDVARGVNRAAQRQGFLLDRRSFRAELPVATISEQDPGSAQRAAAVLESHRGPEWRAGAVFLLRESPDPKPPRFEEVAWLPLADAEGLS